MKLTVVHHSTQSLTAYDYETNYIEAQSHHEDVSHLYDS
jgi:hypothetical protein